MARTKTANRKRLAARRNETPHTQGMLLRKAREEYKRKVNDTEGNLDDLNHDYDALKYDYDGLKQSHSELQDEHEELRGEYIGKSKLLDDRELEVHAYKSCSWNLEKTLQITDLEAKIRTLKREKRALEDTVENQDLQISELRRQSPRSAVNSADLTRIRHERDAAESDRDYMDAELENEKSKNTVLCCKIQDWKNDWEKQFAANDALKEKLKDAMIQVSEAKDNKLHAVELEDAKMAAESALRRALIAEKNEKTLLEIITKSNPLIDQLTNIFGKIEIGTTKSTKTAARVDPRGPLPSSSSLANFTDKNPKNATPPVPPSEPTAEGDTQDGPFNHISVNAEMASESISKDERKVVKS